MEINPTSSTKTLNWCFFFIEAIQKKYNLEGANIRRKAENKKEEILKLKKQRKIEKELKEKQDRENNEKNLRKQEYEKLKKEFEY